MTFDPNQRDGWVRIACGHCGSIETFTKDGTYTAHDHGNDRVFNLHVEAKGGDGGGGIPAPKPASFSVAGYAGLTLPFQVGTAGTAPHQGGSASGLLVFSGGGGGRA